MAKVSLIVESSTQDITRSVKEIAAETLRNNPQIGHAIVHVVASLVRGVTGVEDHPSGGFSAPDETDETPQDATVDPTP